MSAAEMRQAAETLRERAKDAVDVTGAGDWFAEPRSTHFPSEWGVRSSGGFVSGDTVEEEARYIATMHPGVGLALADLLEEAASYREQQRSLLARTFGDDKADDFMPKPEPHSLAVARLVNGGGE